MNNKEIYIGADGGGTKIVFLLEHPGGLRTLKLTRSVNPNDIGFEQSADIVAEGMLRLCGDAGATPADVKGVFAGIAGASTDEYKTLLQTRLEDAFPAAAVGAGHDGENILYAAFPETDGVIVICGTGSSCFYKKDGKIHRIGGYSVFDLDGNGYEIGRRAVAHALRCHDKRDIAGALCQKIDNLCGGSALDDLKRLLTLSKKELAAFALPVFEAAAEGDPYADAIIEGAALYVASCINHAGRAFLGDFPAVIAGSIGTDEAFLKRVKKHAAKQASVSALRADPAEGALRKAKFLYQTRKGV